MHAFITISIQRTSHFKRWGFFIGNLNVQVRNGSLGFEANFLAPPVGELPVRVPCHMVAAHAWLLGSKDTCPVSDSLMLEYSCVSRERGEPENSEIIEGSCWPFAVCASSLPQDLRGHIGDWKRKFRKCRDSKIWVWILVLPPIKVSVFGQVTWLWASFPFL